MENTMQVFMESSASQHQTNLNSHVILEASQPFTNGSSFIRPEHSISLDEMTSLNPGNVTMSEEEAEIAMTKYPTYKAAAIVWQVAPVLLFLFGTCGNVLTLLVLRTLRLDRTSMHIFLRALAISDLCVLYTGLLRWWIFWTFQIDIREKHQIICKLHLWLVYVSLAVSAWLLVVMTLERTCSTCLPHRVSTFCTKKRAWVLIVFIVIFHGLIQGHFLFGMIVKDNGQCVASSEEYGHFIHTVWPYVDICLLSLLPFTFLIAGNAIIVWKTFLSLKTAAELNLTSGNNAIRRRRHASTMTFILLGLSAVFLLTTSPICAYNLWEGRDWANSSPERQAMSELLWAIVNILMYSNNTFNFYLYCLSGRKFRREMQRHLSRRRNESHSMLSGPSIQLHRFTSDYRRTDSYENGKISSPSPTKASTRTHQAFL